MGKQKQKTEAIDEPAAESDAIRMSDIAGGEGADIADLQENEPADEDVWQPEPKRGMRPIVVALAAAGIAAVAVVAVKIVHDRRSRAHGYRKALDQLQDARDSVLSAAAELPDRGRAVLQRVTRR